MKVENLNTCHLSALEPQNFLGVVEGLTGFGFNFLGGYTDRGVYKLVNTYNNVKSWLKGEKGALGFINLFHIRHILLKSSIIKNINTIEMKMVMSGNGNLWK